MKYRLILRMKKLMSRLISSLPGLSLKKSFRKEPRTSSIVKESVLLLLRDIYGIVKMHGTKPFFYCLLDLDYFWLFSMMFLMRLSFLNLIIYGETWRSFLDSTGLHFSSKF